MRGPQRPLDGVKARAGHRLAAEGIDLHRRRRATGVRPFRHLHQIGGGEAGMGRTVAGQGGAGFLRAPQPLVPQDDGPAEGERHHPAFMRAVEGEGEKMQLPRGGGGAIERAGGPHMVRQRPMGHAHTLRMPVEPEV